MKTKELIKILQEADPEGETECVVDGRDIYFASNLPYYYDGKPWLLIHDLDKKGKSWSIKGIKLMTSGDKVNIHTLDVEDVIWNDPYNVIIDYGTLKDKALESVQNRIEGIRTKAKECEEELGLRQKD